MPDIWIQLENRAWDVAPWRIDRMTGLAVAAAATPKVIVSPETGVSRTVNMWKPLPEDALILRRYTANWAAPDDRKVNPWDRNEPNPTDTGTMGTIPGPVIECQLGETVTVHFRNKDMRSGRSIEARAHSLHTHGFVFDPRYDGAYPLSPPDPTQPVGGEAALWAGLGVTGFKRGDRVPPGATFTYTWQTIGWPTTAGVWLYHDHSICDMDNVSLGAIGIVVIHNPADPEDLIIGNADLPGGSFIGSVWVRQCFGFPFEVKVLPNDLIRLGRIPPLDQPPGIVTHEVGVIPPGGYPGAAAGMEMLAAVGGHTGPGGRAMQALAGITTRAAPAAAGHPTFATGGRPGPRARDAELEGVEFHSLDPDSLAIARDAHHRIDDDEDEERTDDEETRRGGKRVERGQARLRRGERTRHGAGERHEEQGAARLTEDASEVNLARSFPLGDILLELNPELTRIIRFCLTVYRTPPAKAQYLLLFHSLIGATMCINGRKYLGNTPTVIAGPQTDMRFGVVGMGNVDGFHTFHLHGHRWTLNGPHGTDRAAIQGSIPDTPVSQFEDTRTFGPANSFAFTIKEGSLPGVPSFMGAPPGAAIGEWHMHCHVLNHMMDGMMGSLLVINGGEFVTALPVGVECPPLPGGGPPGGGGAAMTATVQGGTTNCTWNDVASGTPETTIMVGGTVTWEQIAGCGNHTVASVGTPSFPAVNSLPGSRTFSAPGDYKYQCGIHGGDPVAKTGMWGIVHVVP